MQHNAHWLQPLREFAETSDLTKTFLALDLDGTALLEDHGKVFISSSVEKGVKALHELKIPVVINTLRFPLSVINTVGHEWYDMADLPIPTVLLNGSVLGYIKCDHDQLQYEEIASFPLGREEIDSTFQGVAQLAKAGIDDLLLFLYSRDWKEGETLWTPEEEKIPELKEKFVSASRVISGPVERLAEELSRREICMMTLFVDRPENTLMAYQHSKRSNFFTAAGVNKASGLREIATRLNLPDPTQALGAGDTSMDTFLSEVGLAVIVGEAKLPFRGVKKTIRVATPLELGELVLAYAKLLRAKSSR
jgi:hydroxymethylpyrimidine pyrophosphatase-like HAD family hydrolase